ncbi:MAG TPA: DUF2207 domain-containing protein [Longimicrobiales bacterium]|nr:DUF2207 domain-containing protein [Longimicrobiales bacterium]
MFARRIPLTIGLLCVLLLPAVLPAQRALHIERFDAEIVVLRNGGLVVTERITARFEGQWNGIYRSIPIRYETPQKLNYTLQLDVEGATDDAGVQLRHELETQRGYRKVKIWVPGAQNATRTVVLRYRVANGLRFFEEHDELYWNVTGNDWDVPIAQASARILLPAEATGLRATAYTGAYGARGTDATVQIVGNSVEIESQPLAFREGLTAVVGWNPGVVSRPTAVARTASVLRGNLIFLLPLLALAIMWRIWNRHGRDPARRAIAPAYEPPQDLTPAEVGALIDHKPDLHDITATVVDLAVRGYLIIEERTDKVLGLFSSTGYTFKLIRSRADWGELRAHERRLLEAMFEAGDEVEDDDLKNKFYKDLPGIRDSVLNQLIDVGHYKRRPDRVVSQYIVLAGFAAIAVGGLGIFLNNQWGIDSPTAPIIASVMTAFIVGVFAFVMPSRTALGTRTLEHVLGFEEFLRRVESDRFERVIKTPEMFEKFLPYAMALKVDRNWCRAFADIYREPPRWYAGSSHGHFHLNSFSSSLSRMTAATGAVMTAAPRSNSGSSGFGGGGFSGGGFGGGGGGGF